MVNAGRVVSKDQILDQVWEHVPARDGSALEPYVIAASLAAAQGGEITVDTAPGRGAAFHVRLPQAGIFQVSATGSQGELP